MPFAESECFRIYREVRKGFPDSGLELGQGINEYPPATSLARIVDAIFGELVSSGRIRDYSGQTDRIVEKACAHLVQEHFGLPRDAGARVLFTNGASEGINLCIGALSRDGLAAMLPQPSYFIYEQSVLQHGMPIAGRYRRFRDRVLWEDTGAAYVLVQAEPSPLEGDLAPDAAWFRQDARRRFDMIDTVFLVPKPGCAAEFEQQMRWKLEGVSFDRACLLLTPSKDLSYPALRAGLVYTGSHRLIEYIERDRSARTFSVSPVIGYLCLAHLCAVDLLGHARYEGLRLAKARNRDLSAWLSRLGIGDWYPRDLMLALVSHLEEMAAHCQNNHETASAHSALAGVDASQYVAGFSIFPKLDISIESHADLVGIANRIGNKKSIFLNPSVVFGGTMSTWDGLFRNEARVRVNLSMDTCRLHRGLNGLAEALRECEG